MNEQDKSKKAATRRLTKSNALRKTAEPVGEPGRAFRLIFDGMSDGVLLADAETKKFYQANKAICKMLGYSYNDLIGLGVPDIHPEESLSFIMETFDRQSKNDLWVAKDIPVKKKNGSIFYADINALRLVVDGNAYMAGIFRDITEHKRVEEALRKSEAEYQLLVENANEAILVACDGRLHFVNKKATEIIGYSKKELTSRPFFEFIHLDDRKMVLDRHIRRVRGEQFPGIYSIRVITKDGNTKWVELNTVLITWKGKPATLNFASDVTERRTAENQLLLYQKELRSLASQLFLAEEHERRRIATEVHDHLSQDLAVCKMKLSALSEAVIATGWAEPLMELRNIIEQLIDEARSMTFELGSPLLYEFGLEAALEHLTHQMQKEHGILFHFKDDGQVKPLDDNIRVLLFQAVRELLINIVKHSQAHLAGIHTKKRDSDIIIIVEDDGIGFNPSEISSKSRLTECFGLFAVRERLNYIGGHIVIKSEIGHGTRITIVAPLKSTRERRRRAHE